MEFILFFALVLSIILLTAFIHPNKKERSQGKADQQILDSTQKSALNDEELTSKQKSSIQNIPNNATEAAYKEFWESVKVRIGGLKNHDTELKIFGANHHQYRIKPCLLEEEIARFEEQHSLRLPEDYRSYLKYFGDGGVGPSYGVISLCMARTEGSPIQTPFKFTKPYFPAIDEYSFFVYDKPTGTTTYFFTSREEAIEAIYGSEEAYKQAVNIVDDETLDAYTDERFREYELFTKYGGILWLCEEGCGHISFLVVRGEEYGKMWGDSMVSDYGIFPHTTKGDTTFSTRLTFAEWFVTWLDAAESELGK